MRDLWLIKQNEPGAEAPGVVVLYRGPGLSAFREGNDGVLVQPSTAMEAEALGVKAEPQQPVTVRTPPEKEAEQQCCCQQYPGNGKQHPPEGKGRKQEQNGR